MKGDIYMDKQEVQMPQKPASVIREEFIDDMTNLINDVELPAFIIAPILKDMYAEAKDAACRQYEYDKRQYEMALDIFNNQTRTKADFVEGVDEANENDG